MALNKTTMAQLRVAKLAATYPNIPMSGDVYTEMIKYFEADSEGIIAEFTANAVVQPGSFTTPSGGNVTGAGTVT